MAMKRNYLIIYFFISLSILVLVHTTPINHFTKRSIDSNDFFDSSINSINQVEKEINEKNSNIGKIPRKGKKIESNIVDITVFRGLGFGNDAYGAPTFLNIADGELKRIQKEDKPLTIKDFFMTLALWHLAKEFNEYNKNNLNNDDVRKESLIPDNVNTNSLNDYLIE